jgi:hypothetical protein
MGRERSATGTSISHDSEQHSQLVCFPLLVSSRILQTAKSKYIGLHDHKPGARGDILRGL